MMGEGEMKIDIAELIGKMTLEEKAGLCSGMDFWYLKGVEHLGVPQIMVTDGPHGLRKQEGKSDHLGLNASIASTCFPSGASLANTWNTELVEEVGRALGEECQAEGVGILLGPAMNIKRTPLCGRNFEYFSEDPVLSGEMAVAHVKGVQSQNVGTCVKHFAVNNQEYRRFSADAVLSKRALREIYLSGFERVISKASPYSVMCAFNKVNGVSCFESHELLQDILKGEWDYAGVTMTDWAAMNDRVKSLAAGLDLEMPGSGGVNDRKIVEAVQEGRLAESILNETVERILKLIFKVAEGKHDVSYSREKHHEIARKAAEEGTVLLKNESRILPLQPGTKLAIIGTYAETPRYQGGGSSHIHPTKLDCVLEYFQKDEMVYCPGFDPETDEIVPELEQRAIEAVKDSEVTILFLGLPDSYESESFDRAHMRLPENQNHLIERIAEVTEKVVVVLAAGAPIEMPWIDKVQGVLDTYLCGQAGAGAAYDIIMGKVNPSGKLAETFPVRHEDTPAYLNYPGDFDQVNYREDIYVGYRYYEKKDRPVLFPFGHGLSYTEFSYETMCIDKDEMLEDEVLQVSVKVKNTGNTTGKETVQIYVGKEDAVVSRPQKELKAFGKIELKPQEEKTAVFTLSRRDFAVFHEKLDDWYVEEGKYQIYACSSSKDVRLQKDIFIKNKKILKEKLTLNSTIEELMKYQEGKALGIKLGSVIIEDIPPVKNEADVKLISEGMGFDVAAMVGDLQLKMLVLFSNGSILAEDVERELEQINTKIQIIE